MRKLVEKLAKAPVMAGLVRTGTAAMAVVALSSAPSYADVDGGTTPDRGVSGDRVIFVPEENESVEWKIFDDMDYEAMYARLSEKTKEEIEKATANYQGVGDPEDFRNLKIAIAYLTEVLREMKKSDPLDAKTILGEGRVLEKLRDYAVKRDVKEILRYLDDDYDTMEKYVDPEKMKLFLAKMRKRDPVAYVVFEESMRRLAIKTLYGKKIGIEKPDGTLERDFSKIERKIEKLRSEERTRRNEERKNGLFHRLR